MIVAIAGQPNVGKSTLLNRLAGTDVAIVTEIPGTTRDLLREELVIDGLPITILDTAGLRDTTDPVEREGVRRAWNALEQAELILFMVDDRLDLAPADEALLQRLPADAETLLVRNKCDLSGRHPVREPGDRVTLRLSAQTGEGMGLLTEEIKRAAGLSTGTQGLFSARTRHVEALQRTLACVREGERLARSSATLDLIAEELRLAQKHLAEVTGEVTSEDLLGAIFSRFCIGK
jgi:tRNA modification GTPase